jgi:translation initiation factor 2-alpha kinase 4
MHMNDVFVYLKRLNVLHKVYLSPLSSFNDKFYRGGLLFQCLYDNKKRDVFAAGGRYDRLIRDHRPKTQGSYDECHAVGFNLAWEKVFKSMLRHQKSVGKAFLKKNEEAAQGPWAERRVSSSLELM